MFTRGAEGELPADASPIFQARIDALAALAAMQSVDGGAVAAAMLAAGKPERIADAVREARIDAIRCRFPLPPAGDVVGR